MESIVSFQSDLITELAPLKSQRSRDFLIIRDGLKKNRLDCLNRRVAELQQARKWEPLKQIRNKRGNVSKHFDRLSAKRIAETSDNCLVTVGYSEGVKYNNYRGILLGFDDALAAC